ncbi:MAG: hypothetical protein U1C72_02745 [Candidatus Pacearchaeota archaeon]|nr:hypothetical protein [Candidatus Pacearchaeota archaeon]
MFTSEKDKEYAVRWVLIPLAIGLLFMVAFGVFDRQDKDPNEFNNSAEW